MAMAQNEVQNAFHVVRPKGSSVQISEGLRLIASFQCVPTRRLFLLFLVKYDSLSIFFETNSALANPTCQKKPVLNQSHKQD